ncbi:MAG: hypothetical protein IPH27_02415 [Actinomycetales bacterium]|nr:hypothetical protein [Candidatus Phosphoribacter baldrii]MBK6954384.1 hypothetical protein [Candidatus Phosphoribacter baldrii]
MARSKHGPGCVGRLRVRPYAVRAAYRVGVSSRPVLGRRAFALVLGEIAGGCEVFGRPPADLARVHR